MGSVLTTLIVFMIFYYIFRRIIKLFTISMGEDTQQQYQQSRTQRDHYNRTSSSSNEGEVNIKYAPKNNKKELNTDSAETIDFEEIK